LTPEVIIDSNFADSDSYIYFGADPLVDLRNYIGESVSHVEGSWALFVDEIKLNGNVYTSFENVALLESSNINIGLPSNILLDTNALFKDLGFLCPTSSSSCAYVGNCDEVAGALPVLNFTFAGGGLTFDVMITSEVYLLQEDSQCTTLFDENTDSSAGFILGDPFFRNSTIALDFATKSISLFSKDVNTAIIPEVWPIAFDNLSYNVSMAVDDEVVYTGRITVGDMDTGVGE